LEPKISVADFNRLSREKLPFAELMGLQLETITESHVIMRAGYSEQFIRPGGTISGPLLMALADAALYALVLRHAPLCARTGRGARRCAGRGSYAEIGQAISSRGSQIV
jgi:acyl-coenzyme A thioesterase PaaI-like protein